jgi:hypothetical protein
MAVKGKKDRYFELKEGGPYDTPGESSEMFKCTDCGAETHPEDGWNGAPNPHRCHPGCQANHGDWKIGAVSRVYKRNYDRIFPDAPGAGLYRC